MFTGTQRSNTPTRRRRLSGALFSLLALAALLLASQARPAGAAPPVLTASENPVVIPSGSSSKNITLGWNLNGYPKATLSVQENGGPVVATFAVIAQTGSLPLTATYGTSYTATLIDPAAGGPLATLQITTKRPATIPLPFPLPSPPPVIDHTEVLDTIGECLAKPCITGVDLQPHGAYVEFTVTTTKAALFQMAICAVPFTASGACSLPVSGIFSVQPATAWSSHAGNLLPARSYHYLVTATDANGNQVKRTGAFATLRRQVQVTFVEVAVTDDSDDLSACECVFWFKAGSTPTQSIGPFDLSTGESQAINVTFTLADAPASLTLRVKGRDDDKRWGGHVCGDSSSSPDVWTNGSNSCADWSSAQRSVDVHVTGFGESFTEPFEIAANGSPLTFTVSGVVTVTYVP